MRDATSPIGEFELIERWSSLLGDGGADVVVGIGDDCAALDDGGDELLLLTTDMMAEGIHFLPDTDPEDLGDKLLAVNLSDIAAMGGRPGYALVSLAAARGTDPARLEALYRGLRRRAECHGVQVVGGDTTASRSGLVLSLALTGRVARERMWTRAGARPGDRVLVSGTLGDSAAGLVLARGGGGDGEDARALLERHLRPEPRLELAAALAAVGGVTAGIDLSDGLASDLAHVCQRSAVGAEIQLARLPLSGALRRHAAAAGMVPLPLATSGGEDYELCLTAAPVAVARLLETAAGTGVPLTEIGRIVGSGPAQVRWIGADGEPAGVAPGWDHFPP